MPDQVYKGTAYGDVTIYEAWPAWLQTFWLNALNATGYKMPAPPFTPTYDAGEVHWPTNDGTVATAAIDRFQLASKETAAHLAKQYGALVSEVPFVGAGPVTSSAVVRTLVFPNGVQIIAGMMAAPFTLNPEDQFPGVADHAVKLILAARGAA